jgi:hypothetical protein
MTVDAGLGVEFDEKIESPSLFCGKRLKWHSKTTFSSKTAL